MKMGILNAIVSLECMIGVLCFSAVQGAWGQESEQKFVRFATFNASLYGQRADEVAQRLAAGDDTQARTEAEIIQRVRPDVLLLNEVDFDEAGKLIETFQKKYLAVGQNFSQSPDGPAEPIEYSYRYFAPCNTGVASGHDLDRNGQVRTEAGSVEYGGDCWGFGQYPGQYGMVVLSKYPIQTDDIRTFQNFRWQDMPGALLPDDLETREAQDWYNPETLRQFPLSSKSHWDLPIAIGERTIHILVSHPTPPTFDGPEDRNGCRNHDEIRFWADYIGDDSIGKSAAGYIYDDAGQNGGIKSDASFVIMGDLNGDPNDGQGTAGISKLLASPALASGPPPESQGAVEQAKLQGGVNASHVGDPRHDTLDAADKEGPGNLRLDYVLPSKDLKVVASGVFWPQNTDTTFKLVGEFPFPSSDHRLVWVDFDLQND